MMTHGQPQHSDIERLGHGVVEVRHRVRLTARGSRVYVLRPFVRSVVWFMTMRCDDAVRVVLVGACVVATPLWQRGGVREPDAVANGVMEVRAACFVLQCACVCCGLLGSNVPTLSNSQSQWRFCADQVRFPNGVGSPMWGAAREPA